MDHDPVNHPSHYTSHPSGVECIEITRHMGFNLGNAMKYIWRAGLKDEVVPIQDLEKAVWYIQDEIAKRKKAETPDFLIEFSPDATREEIDAYLRNWNLERDTHGNYVIREKE